MTPTSATSQLPLLQENKAQDHLITNATEIFLVPASASLPCPKCQDGPTECTFKIKTQMLGNLIWVPPVWVVP